LPNNLTHVSFYFGISIYTINLTKKRRLYDDRNINELSKCGKITKKKGSNTNTIPSFNGHDPSWHLALRCSRVTSLQCQHHTSQNSLTVALQNRKQECQLRCTKLRSRLDDPSERSATAAFGEDATHPVLQLHTHTRTVRRLLPPASGPPSMGWTPFPEHGHGIEQKEVSYSRSFLSTESTVENRRRRP
jgi:hypothetical protein